MRFSEIRLLATYSFVCNSPILVDVGAYHGGVSRLFAERGWRVIAFEPELENRVAFEQNLGEFEQVTCIPQAVSDVSGAVVPFYVSEEHPGIHSLTPFHQTHKVAPYEVKTVRLDDALDQLDVPSVTLLKIDTEGADFLALQGFDFSKYRPEIIMAEFMDQRSLPGFEYTHHDVVSYMKERGYTAFVSEWAPIKEYGRRGVPTEPHVWVQCALYPLDHEPAWGNLIFVPDQDADKFSLALETYLAEMKSVSLFTKLVESGGLARIRKVAYRIPAARKLYQFLKGSLI